MEMKSKIKTLFNDELRHYIAAICDTKRIESNIEKMDLSHRLMITKGLSMEPLGGATNRYVVMIDGYAIKIAVDRQGYKDNWMEFALSNECQPFVTRSYETNGYILVQECVRTITIEEWRLRKTEILKMLDMLGQEYLLGDVGYNDINFTNWGIRDNGDLVILDYAYCHRLSEKLFTCPVCGSLLTYDQYFVHMLCTDRANCHEKYEYNQLKAIQGEEIDWETIEERKHDAVHIPGDLISVEVDTNSNKLLDSRTMVIRSYYDLARYNEIKELEENKMLHLDFTNYEVIEMLSSLNIAKIKGDADRVKELEELLYHENGDTQEPIRCIVDPAFQERLEYDAAKNEKYRDDNEDDTEESYSFDALLSKVRGNIPPTAEMDDESAMEAGYHIKTEEETSSENPVGDVDYDDTNFANWGFRDNGDLVILDSEPTDKEEQCEVEEPIDEPTGVTMVQIEGDEEVPEKVYLNDTDITAPIEEVEYEE